MKNNDLKLLNQQFGKAEKAKDKVFFKKHLSDSLIFRRASGKIDSKEQFLESLGNPDLIYHHIDTEIIKISVSDDNSRAVVKVIVFVKMTNEGRDIEGHYTNLRFFQKQNNTWVLTNWYNEMNDKNNRQYKTTDLQTLFEGFPKLDDDKREILLALYNSVNSSWEKLVDIRFKLLGFVPSISFLLLLELNKLSEPNIKTFGGLVGLMITIAIWLYDKRNSELHDDLISRARKIESELGIETGQFLGRKLNSNFFVKHDVALNIIYFTTMGAFLFFLISQILIV